MRTVRRAKPTIEFETVPSLGLGGTSDARLLEVAAQSGWIIVSHDVNTMKAAAEDRVVSGLGIAGLILIPQSSLSLEIVEDLLLIVTASDAEEWRDSIQFLPI